MLTEGPINPFPQLHVIKFKKNNALDFSSSLPPPSGGHEFSNRQLFQSVSPLVITNFFFSKFLT